LLIVGFRNIGVVFRVWVRMGFFRVWGYKGLFLGFEFRWGCFKGLGLVGAIVREFISRFTFQDLRV
jgi:hypothetical protein